MYIEITPDNYRVQFRYQSTPDYDSEIIDFAKLKQDLVITLTDDTADKTFADIAFAIAHDVAVILNDTGRKVYARLSSYDDGSSYTFDALLTDGRGVWTVTNEDAWSYELIPIGGGGGTADHRQLSNRDAANQHPISSITGLESALEGKQPSGDYATTQELDALAEIVEDKYEKPSAGIPKNDLSEGVQSSLDKADSALQEHQSLAAYRTASEQDVIDNGKQPLINDLATIRSGAALGATALQSVPNTYRTAAAQDIIDNAFDSRLDALEADYAIALTLL